MQTALIYTQKAAHEITLSGLVVEASSLPTFCPPGPLIEQLGSKKNSCCEYLNFLFEEEYRIKFQVNYLPSQEPHVKPMTTHFCCTYQ